MAHPLGDDPHLQLGLAQALYGMGDAAAARQTLETLISRFPQFRSPDGHFLYACTLSDLGETAKADEEFAALLPMRSGEEARVWYARSLVRQGRLETARLIYEDVLKRARLSPRYYRKNQQEWIRTAERELRAM